MVISRASKGARSDGRRHISVASTLYVRAARVIALGVAATAAGAVVLYSYVNVGPIGPIPNLYEPSWQVPGKLASVFAEGIAVALSVVGVVLMRRARRGPRGAVPVSEPS